MDRRGRERDAERRKHFLSKLSFPSEATFSPLSSSSVLLRVYVLCSCNTVHRDTPLFWNWELLVMHQGLKPTSCYSPTPLFLLLTLPA